jgi:hypothetical protein
MLYRDRAAEVAARLAALPGAGRVHDRGKVVRTSAELIRHFKVEGQEKICGWFVTRFAGAADPGAPAHWEDRMKLIRFCGVQDESESELDFQESLDDAVVEFRDNPQLSFGTVAGELKILVAEPRDFMGGAVFHVAECELVVSLDFYHDLTGRSE